MNPSVDDRLASIVRSLADVVLPALPREAALAQEQLHLAIGHLQIIRAQMDSVPAFESEELLDARSLGLALLADGEAGPRTVAALSELSVALNQAVGGEHPRQSRARITGAIDSLLQQMAMDGSQSFRERVAELLVRWQTERSLKDRKWFAVMGFDSDVANAPESRQSR